MKYLHLDLRAIALMRICIATVILADLCIRLTDLEAFYSNTGVAPLTMLFENDWNSYFISIHTVSGLWQVQLLLFMFAFFCAAMLFIGYRTQLFTFLSWFMLLSLHNRNGLILQGGDDLLRMVLFWGIFLPWGAKYSCDSLISREAPELPLVFINVATIAYILQLTYIYTGSALLKGPEWNRDFTALYYAYSLDQIAYPVVKNIYYYPGLLKVLTCFVYYFELLIPVFFFIPFRHSASRTVAVISIMLFHFINMNCLLIGLFPVIGIATVSGLLPSEAMNFLERYSSKFRSHAAASFAVWGELLKNIIRWKAPVYLYRPAVEKLRIALLIFLIIFVFDWNFSNLTFVSSKLSDNLRFIGYGLRLDQNWGMFAPGVFKDDGWYVLEGIDKKGKHYDLLHPGNAPAWNKPASVVSMFRNDRWRKYSENFIFSSNEFMRGYYSNYEKRIWNEAHPEMPVDTVRVYYMKEFTKPDYRYVLPEKEMLWETY